MAEKMKKSRADILVFAALAVLAVIFFLVFTELKKCEVSAGGPAREYTSREDNAECLKCHAVNRFEMANPDDTSQNINSRMQGDCIIDTNLYYSANHWDFRCTDCHSDEYETYPHDGGLKLLEINVCLDCHEDYDETAHFRFEKIAEAFRTNVHYKMDSLHFNCWQCHDPHYNKYHFRDSLQCIAKNIDYANAFCLQCHGDETPDNRFEFFGGTRVDLLGKHELLHKPEHHLEKLRCIDCHAAVDDSVLVSHAIMPKESSVRECSHCHSENTLLADNLFKNRRQENVRKCGFMNSFMLADHYVPGAHRNKHLLTLAVILVGALLLFMITHIILRSAKRK